MTGKALMGDHKIEESRKEAEQQFSGINNQWEELLKLIDEKKLSLLAKQKEIEDYMNLLNEFSSWMDGVEKKLNEPLTLTGDPHNITNQLHEMKVFYNTYLVGEKALTFTCTARIHTLYCVTPIVNVVIKCDWI